MQIYIKWTSENFVVTTERVIHRSGVVAKSGIEIPLDRINTVFFNQSLFERLLGAGDLGVESAGEGGQQTFAAVRKPNLVQQEIYRAMEAWAETNGYQFAGPEREVFIEPPFPGKEDEAVTEIQIPVEKIETELNLLG